MPWVRAKLRGQMVYARADQSGRLIANGGRVEIRYRTDDGRMYQAAERNLEIGDATVLPDGTCSEAEAVGAAPKAAAKKTARKKGATAATATPAPVAEGTIVAYTDGACSGNPGPAGLGVVLLTAGACVERSEYLGEATNNIAELTAILRALEEIAAREDCAGHAAAIHTDSQYAIGVVQKGWKAKKNVALVAHLREALGRHGRATLIYVKGHAGIPLNERADELARRAVETTQTERRVVPRSSESSNVSSP